MNLVGMHHWLHQNSTLRYPERRKRKERNMVSYIKITSSKCTSKNRVCWIAWWSCTLEPPNTIELHIHRYLKSVSYLQQSALGRNKTKTNSKDCFCCSSARDSGLKVWQLGKFMCWNLPQEKTSSFWCRKFKPWTSILKICNVWLELKRHSGVWDGEMVLKRHTPTSCWIMYWSGLSSIAPPVK
jgi:hypothetical protein